MYFTIIYSFRSSADCHPPPARSVRRLEGGRGGGGAGAGVRNHNCETNRLICERRLFFGAHYSYRSRIEEVARETETWGGGRGGGAGYRYIHH